MEDRLSELPVHLIHKIMSFLPPEETLNFQFLSKSLSYAWLTCPTLCLYSNPHYRRREIDFINHTRFTLRRHRNTPLQTLIFNLSISRSSNGSDFAAIRESSANLLEEIADFAIEKSVPTLSISCCGESNCNQELIFVHYRNPRALGVFSAGTIRDLKLYGLNLPSWLTVDCPVIEDFAISVCEGVNILEFSGNVKLLRSVRVSKCRGIQVIRIGESQLSLESFTYEAPWVNAWPCKIEIHRACRERLRFLEVRENPDIGDHWLRTNLARCVSLESLKLYDCEGVRNVMLNNPSLKCLTLCHCESLMNIYLALPSLECLELNGFKLRQDRCDINIGACTNLKRLEITRFSMSKEWITNNLMMLLSLEELKLDCCTYTSRHGEIRFQLENLRKLQLVDAWGLDGIVIECPNLASFEYNGREFESSPVVITSGLKNAEIQLQTMTLTSDPNCLKNYLSFFRSCNTLSLKIDSHNFEDDFIIPEKLRRGLIDIPSELKHLKIQVGYLWGIENFVGFVDSLLWLAHRPETISFVINTLEILPEEEFLIKFNYCRGDASDVRKEIKDGLTCCSRHRNTKCWRHDLAEVVIQNFADHHRDILRKYFVKNTKAIITVVKAV